MCAQYHKVLNIREQNIYVDIAMLYVVVTKTTEAVLVTGPMPSDSSAVVSELGYRNLSTHV